MSLRVRIACIETITPHVKRFHFVSTNGALPAFSPGSNIRIRLPIGGAAGVWNSYSLTADPWSHEHYTIAVRKEDAERSRGGSIYLHEQAREGEELEMQPPVNQFLPVRTASKHLLIAGGIGVTPFLSYLPTLRKWETPAELHYSFRGAENAAFLDELAQYRALHFQTYDSEQGERIAVEEIIAAQPAGTHVYTCGPWRLIEAVRAAATVHGWPENHVHFEQFSAGELPERRPFSAELARHGRTIAVSTDETLLEALERENIAVPFSCRIGGCGTCHVGVLGGAIEHYDHCLSGEERATGATMISCCSRAAQHSLILDL